jgi:hypothetical protein
MEELVVCRKELDTHTVLKWLAAESRGKICSLWMVKKGFVNPLAYETQIVKRLNSLQSH